MEGKIRGRVTDRKTGEPLIGATVLAMWPGSEGETRYKESATNIDGYYLMLFRDDDHSRTVLLKAAYIGYVSLEVTHSVGQVGEANYPLLAECDIAHGGPWPE